MQEKIINTLEALKANRMEAYFADTKEEAVEIAVSLMEKGSTVAVGGSVTLKELGMLEILRSGDYNFLDRYTTTDRSEINDIFRKSFFADTYLCSTNALTEKGELYNVDGTGNRVAAMLFGPKSVIVLVGVNKIVADIDEAEKRVKAVAGPLNAQRLNKDTYCAKKGICAVYDTSACMSDGCHSKDRICRDYVVMAEQAEQGRVKVILVNEKLGY